MEQIAERLWWWTAHHPEWKQEVSSYALVDDGTLVLFDPLVPPDDPDGFWTLLDDDVAHHGPPAILVSVYWHVRSAPEILARYDGTTLFAHEPARRGMRNRVEYTHTFGDGDRLPGGVEAIGMHHMNEAAFWLPRHGALLVGDSVVRNGDRAELCPRRWLRQRETAEQHRAAVERALERKPERLLLTHGGPMDPNDLRL